MKINKQFFKYILLFFFICFISLYSCFYSRAANSKINDVQIINASDVDSSILNLKADFSSDNKYILNMDTDLNINALVANDLTVTGSGKLTTKCIHLDKFTIKSGANVEVINGHIRIGDPLYGSDDDYSLVIEENAKLRVNQDSSYIAQDSNELGTERCTDCCIYCNGHIKSSGNVDIYSNHYDGIRCIGSLSIDKGIFNLQCDGSGYTDMYYNNVPGHGRGIVSTCQNNFNVIGGTVNIVTEEQSLDVGDINIFNGNVYIKSNDEYGRVIYTSNKITISGGKVEAVSNFASKYVIRGYSISIADNLSITVPQYGKLHVDDDYYPYYESYVTDINDNVVNRVVIESSSNPSNTSPYSNEWVNGKWYNSDGTQTYEYSLIWKSNSNGWWVEDNSGWYPASIWQKIDGAWYYFDSNGYMASNEWIDGWWINKDGSCTYNGVGSWKSNSNGWWYSDTTGWYASNMWLKIDNKWYYFKSNGYIATNQRIDGYWIDSNGVCN